MGVRWANSATVLRSGDVLATGSDPSTELLTPGAAAWRSAGDLPSGGSPRSYEQRLLDDGRVMLTGTCEDCATTVEAGPDADFGDVYAGHRSPLLWVTVENTGREPLLLGGVSVDITGVLYTPGMYRTPVIAAPVRGVRAARRRASS